MKSRRRHLSHLRQYAPPFPPIVRRVAGAAENVQFELGLFAGVVTIKEFAPDDGQGQVVVGGAGAQTFARPCLVRLFS